MTTGLILETPADGSILVAPINQLCTSFGDIIILKMSDEEIENSGGLYAYKAYIETLLCYGSEAKNAHLQLGMYYKDSIDEFNSLVGDAMKKRGKPFLRNYWHPSTVICSSKTDLTC